MAAKNNHGVTYQSREVFQNSLGFMIFVTVSKNFRCGVRRTTDVNIMLSLLNNVLTVVETEGGS